MNPLLAGLIAGLLALPIGLWTRHDLTQLRYRTPDETNLPHPGTRWWVVATTITAATSLAIAAARHPHPALYLPLLPLLATGSWLAAVDADVMRLPNRTLGATAAASSLTVLGVAAIINQPTAALHALAGAALAGGLFWALHTITKGGVGMGDVKLAALIGGTLAPLALNLVLPALLAGSILAWIWNTARHHTGPLPYGPWLLAGAILTATVA